MRGAIQNSIVVSQLEYKYPAIVLIGHEQPVVDRIQRN